ncbi:hypothetical protein DL771_002403 [Monosporascus sp. 5C6A]|nr:hypothetical protein DL771_002403 [Monosporascus sp. 5C6A]
MRFRSLLAGPMALSGVQPVALAKEALDNHQLIKRASLTQVQNFGTNPSGIKMFIYVPAKLQAKPPADGVGATCLLLDGECLLWNDRQVMAAVYPDMFEAASEFSGEPAGCFSTNSVRGWNGQCAGGQIHHTPAEWASIVHAMYPTYKGQYPRMQIYHGDVDTTLNINSYNESITEWSGIFGYSGTPTKTLNSNPGPKTNQTEALTRFGIM